jgi:hypothetical protein
MYVREAPDIACVVVVGPCVRLVPNFPSVDPALEVFGERPGRVRCEGVDVCIVAAATLHLGIVPLPIL